jgi:putative transposase
MTFSNAQIVISKCKFLLPISGAYLIPILFRPLKRVDRLIRRVRLSEFWLSLWRRYRHGVLEQRQVEWIIKAKEKSGRSVDIANAWGISVRRVQQLYSSYRETGSIPILRKPGRPKAPELTEHERSIIKAAYERLRICACYLEDVLSSSYGVKINHRRIHRVLREEGYALSEPRKQRRRKWIRYEREHSNSLWHTDWHQIKDPRWRGSWLIAYEDDASRLITGFGVYPTLTSDYSVEVLDRAIGEYGKPVSTLSDHGSTFYAVESVAREKGLTVFEEYLIKNKIRFITGRVDHPQTNGKIEKFFDIFEKKVKYSSSIEEFMKWYNEVRPHGALDLKRAQTPLQAFYEKMPDPHQLISPDILTRSEIIS